MTITVDATYENGTLKLERSLPLAEHEKVRVTVQQGPSLAEQMAGMMGWKGSAELAEYFAMDKELEYPSSAEEP
jgi:predicted DNA-binding antitoxin AbrB/MazE fold protein